jgi:N-methylhydantoinase A/oxoprolinase/acetone carboxylase beta subunit
LEGDVNVVGVIGLSRAPYLRKARKRTALGRIELAEGRVLDTVCEFLDVSAGFDPGRARSVLERLAAAGAGAVCVAEAFAPDDASNEQAMAVLAGELGIPATTSSELSGLYGLELRTLTAALNASILPIALGTAELVREGVAAAGVAAPVMVMRGDGGATDLDGFRRAPARTLYSGPAASVAGALRTGRIHDGVIVEVGGTSTNVAAIKAGRPVLSYVQVGRHATAVRALDVRVAGVAGGSMLRTRRRRVYGVGPRSAHIAGLPYSCFLKAEEVHGAEATEVAPRPGDPSDYLVLSLADGRRAALTTTCAANALGLVEPDDYAAGDARAAAAAFEVAGRYLGLPGPEVARRMLSAVSQAIGDLVAVVADQHHLNRPVVVAVGGGAGVLGRVVAGALGLECVIPPGAEVISSVGDALSLVRSERERTFTRPGALEIDGLVAEVEAEAVAAGAAPASLDVVVTQVPDRGAVRVVATGALSLGSGVVPGRPPVTAAEAEAEVARRAGFGAPRSVGSYWLAAGPGRTGQVMLLDRFGDVALEVTGEALVSDAEPEDGFGAAVTRLVERYTRHVGPLTTTPTAWIVRANRLQELRDPDSELLAAALTVEDTGSDLSAVIVGRV